MNRKLLFTFLWCLAASPLFAQKEVPSAEQNQQWLKSFPTLEAKSFSKVFSEHVSRMKNASDVQKINLVRIANDYAKIPDSNKSGSVLHYTVDPMSETQYLPDVYPFDGEANKPVRILSARNEYEPASFVLYSLKDQGKVQFVLSDLKAQNGDVFSKDDLDLKTVKVWYQNGNGWYSYFQDTGLKLCPELLLNDEDLIRVDTKKTANFAKLVEADGTVSEQWLTPPRELDKSIEDTPTIRIGETFRCMKPNFRDAKKFSGASLNQGEFKQFYLTAHVTEKYNPGLYRGTVTLKNAKEIIGFIPVELRILPVILPRAGTYANPDKPFLTPMYEYVGLVDIMKLNGNDFKLAERQLRSILKNFVRHNELTPNYRDRESHPEYGMEAGMDFSQFWAGGMANQPTVEMRFSARRLKEKLIRTYGHAHYLIGWGDEYDASTARAIRAMVDVYKDEGFLFWGDSVHTYAYLYHCADFFNPAIKPDYSSVLTAEKYMNLDPEGWIGWYASQHTGVENPAYIRRQYGMGPYRAGLTTHTNYAHHLDGYNDIRGSTYRSMNFVYGTADGVIDTLGWEAYREGLDDIRYATLLKKMAVPLLRSENREAVYAARRAMHCLAEMNTDSFDLTAARLEMIAHILTLQKFAE